jgi:putative ABC transport system ATP-binding protein
VSTQLRGDDRILQALNRLTFGPRPGDAEKVRAAGLKRWIDQQLDPQRIPENPLLAMKLKTLDSLTMSSEELAAHRSRTIGIVFQSFQLLPRMTLEENVELPLRLAEVPRGDRPARVRDALERVGLAARTRHRPTELSGGEQQRAAIARALVNQPMILLADEPTGNLDTKTGEEIMSLIAQIHRPPSGPGRTVVMVTHERVLAERYADRIVTLSDGAISREERLR